MTRKNLLWILIFLNVGFVIKAQTSGSGEESDTTLEPSMTTIDAFPTTQTSFFDERTMPSSLSFDETTMMATLLPTTIPIMATPTVPIMPTSSPVTDVKTSTGGTETATTLPTETPQTTTVIDETTFGEFSGSTDEPQTTSQTNTSSFTTTDSSEPTTFQPTTNSQDETTNDFEGSGTDSPATTTMFSSGVNTTETTSIQTTDADVVTSEATTSGNIGTETTQTPTTNIVTSQESTTTSENQTTSGINEITTNSMFEASGTTMDMTTSDFVTSATDGVISTTISSVTPEFLVFTEFVLTRFRNATDPDFIQNLEQAFAYMYEEGTALTAPTSRKKRQVEPGFDVQITSISNGGENNLTVFSDHIVREDGTLLNGEVAAEILNVNATENIVGEAFRNFNISTPTKRLQATSRVVSTTNSPTTTTSQDNGNSTQPENSTVMQTATTGLVTTLEITATTATTIPDVFTTIGISTTIGTPNMTQSVTETTEEINTAINNITSTTPETTVTPTSAEQFQNTTTSNLTVATTVVSTVTDSNTTSLVTSPSNNLTTSDTVTNNTNGIFTTAQATTDQEPTATTTMVITAGTTVATAALTPTMAATTQMDNTTATMFDNLTSIATIVNVTTESMLTTPTVQGNVTTVTVPPTIPTTTQLDNLTATTTNVTTFTTPLTIETTTQLDNSTATTTNGTTFTTPLTIGTTTQLDNSNATTTNVTTFTTPLTMETTTQLDNSTATTSNLTTVAMPSTIGTTTQLDNSTATTSNVTTVTSPSTIETTTQFDNSTATTTNVTTVAMQSTITSTTQFDNLTATSTVALPSTIGTTTQFDNSTATTSNVTTVTSPSTIETTTQFDNSTASTATMSATILPTTQFDNSTITSNITESPLTIVQTTTPITQTTQETTVTSTTTTIAPTTEEDTLLSTEFLLEVFQNASLLIANITEGLTNLYNSTSETTTSRRKRAVGEGCVVTVVRAFNNPEQILNVIVDYTVCCDRNNLTVTQAIERLATVSASEYIMQLNNSGIGVTEIVRMTFSENGCSGYNGVYDVQLDFTLLDSPVNVTTSMFRDLFSASLSNTYNRELNFNSYLHPRNLTSNIICITSNGTEVTLYFNNVNPLFITAAWSIGILSHTPSLNYLNTNLNMSGIETENLSLFNPSADCGNVTEYINFESRGISIPVGSGVTNLTYLTRLQMNLSNSYIGNREDDFLVQDNIDICFDNGFRDMNDPLSTLFTVCGLRIQTGCHYTMNVSATNNMGAVIAAEDIVNRLYANDTLPLQIFAVNFNQIFRVTAAVPPLIVETTTMQTAMVMPTTATTMIMPPTTATTMIMPPTTATTMIMPPTTATTMTMPPTTATTMTMPPTTATTTVMPPTTTMITPTTTATTTTMPQTTATTTVMPPTTTMIIPTTTATTTMESTTPTTFTMMTPEAFANCTNSTAVVQIPVPVLFSWVIPVVVVLAVLLFIAILIIILLLCCCEKRKPKSINETKGTETIFAPAPILQTQVPTNDIKQPPRPNSLEHFSDYHSGDTHTTIDEPVKKETLEIQKPLQTLTPSPILNATNPNDLFPQATWLSTTSPNDNENRFRSSIHPISLPPMNPTSVSDQIRGNMTPQALRQKGDMERFKNKQRLKKRNSMKQRHKLGPDTDLPTSMAYDKAQRNVDSVLNPPQPTLFNLPKSRKRPHKRQGELDLTRPITDPNLDILYNDYTQPPGKYHRINPNQPDYTDPSDSDVMTPKAPVSGVPDEARDTIRGLLDDAFSLVSPNNTRNNTVGPSFPALTPVLANLSGIHMPQSHGRDSKTPKKRNIEDPNNENNVLFTRRQPPIVPTADNNTASTYSLPGSQTPSGNPVYITPIKKVNENGSGDSAVWTPYRAFDNVSNLEKNQTSPKPASPRDDAREQLPREAHPFSMDSPGTNRAEIPYQSTPSLVDENGGVRLPSTPLNGNQNFRSPPLSARSDTSLTSGRSRGSSAPLVQAIRDELARLTGQSTPVETLSDNSPPNSHR